jgi:hypothetical protein
MHAGRKNFDVSTVTKQTAKKPFRDWAATNIAGADKEDAFHVSGAASARHANLEANGSKSIKATRAVCAFLSASGFELPTRKSAADSALRAQQTQVELVPEIKNEDRSKYGNDYAAGVKSASGAWRIKQMGHRASDN